MNSKKILALCGSLRALSSNRLVLQHAQKLAPPQAQIEIFDEMGNLPLYNPDLDQNPLPHPVLRFREQVRQSCALLISTPEYIHGIPGPLKNALDWLVSDQAMANKPVGMILGSSTDSTHLRPALLDVLTTMSTQVRTHEIVILSGIRKRLTPQGDLIHPQDSQAVQNLIHSLLEH